MNEQTFQQYVPRLIALHRKGLSAEQAAAVVLSEDAGLGPNYLKLLKNGATVEQVARAILKDHHDELERAEIHDVDPGDRARIQSLVEYAAKDLRITAPRVRYFKSSGFTFGGTYCHRWPDEIWVAGDRPYHEMRKLALHETSHAADGDDGQPQETHERTAERFERRGLHWK